MKNIIEKGTSAKNVLLMVAAKEVTSAIAQGFLLTRINAGLDTAGKCGKMYLLAKSYTYNAYAELTGQPSLEKEHKKQVWPEYDCDFHKNNKAANKPKTITAPDGTVTEKPVATTEELQTRYAATSEKQLNNWLRKAQSPKKELIQAELASRVSNSVQAKTAKPAKTAKKVAAKKTATKVKTADVETLPVPTVTEESFESALGKMRALAIDPNTPDSEKAAFDAMIQAMANASK